MKKEFAEGRKAFNDTGICTCTTAPYKRKSMQFALWEAGWNYELHQLEAPGVVIGPLLMEASDGAKERAETFAMLAKMNGYELWRKKKL